MRFALVPMKPLELAKTRLKPFLDDAAREAVSRAMFEDVLECLRRARTVDVIAVVTSERRLLDLALRSGALAVDEGAPRGLNAAAALGTTACVEKGASSVLIVLSDLPLIRPEEVDALQDDISTRPEVRLVRSHEGLGTNAIFRSPPMAIGTRFGGPSCEKHRQAAIEAGVAHSIVDLPGIAFDVDTAADLAELARRSSTCRASLAAERRSGPVERRLA